MDRAVPATTEVGRRQVVLTGRDARFERLYWDHLDALLGYAMRRAGAQAAKEAVAETLFIAWRRLDEVPEQPRAWLIAVTRRTLADQRRAASRSAALHERLAHEQAVKGAYAPDPADTVSERRVVLVALGHLSPADQDLLMLIAWDGLSPAEAATVLGCSRATIAVRLHRARRRFREALAAEGAHGRRLPSVTPAGTASDAHAELREESS
jgi:RNA polymerase sigma-70 factor (ECF subfamily)